MLRQRTNQSDKMFYRHPGSRHNGSHPDSPKIIALAYKNGSLGNYHRSWREYAILVYDSGLESQIRLTEPGKAQETHWDGYDEMRRIFQNSSHQARPRLRNTVFRQAWNIVEFPE